MDLVLTVETVHIHIVYIQIRLKSPHGRVRRRNGHAGAGLQKFLGSRQFSRIQRSCYGIPFLRFGNCFSAPGQTSRDHGGQYPHHYHFPAIHTLNPLFTNRCPSPLIRNPRNHTSCHRNCHTNSKYASHPRPTNPVYSGFPSHSNTRHRWNIRCNPRTGM